MFRLLLTMFCVLALSGCSDSQEKLAAQALEKARIEAKSLPVDQALVLYQRLIDAYPQTAQAELARQTLSELKQKRYQEFSRRSAELLLRVSSVLEGYQAFSGKLPLRLQELDTHEFMFDSKYLAELLPGGAELFLALDSEKARTQMWLQQEGETRVVYRNLGTPLLRDLSLAELDGLKVKWQEVARVGRLTQVKF
jgi:hypothetical protein